MGSDVLAETQLASEIIDSLSIDDCQQLMIDLQDVLELPEMKPFSTYLYVFTLMVVGEHVLHIGST